jgi:serine O-acetyltransferase
MLSSISTPDIRDYVNYHLKYFIPDIKCSELLITENEVGRTLELVNFCFSNLSGHYYIINNNPFFNHLNSNHYIIFLSYLASVLYHDINNEEKAERVFLLNRYLNNVDFFYKVRLPSIFEVVHPLGSVLGNAFYGGRVKLYQGVTIGSSIDGIYPTFKGDVIFYSNSKVIGNCIIGDKVIFGANSFIINVDVPDGVTVVGQFPNHRFLFK